MPHEIAASATNELLEKKPIAQLRNAISKEQAIPLKVLETITKNLVKFQLGNSTININVDDSTYFTPKSQWNLHKTDNSQELKLSHNLKNINQLCRPRETEKFRLISYQKIFKYCEL